MRLFWIFFRAIVDRQGLPPCGVNPSGETVVGSPLGGRGGPRRRSGGPEGGPIIRVQVNRSFGRGLVDALLSGWRWVVGGAHGAVAS